MDEDSPNGSPYETLAKHDQSEMKHDRRSSRNETLTPLSHIRGTIGDENLTSLGFPPATVRSSLTPALNSFIRSILDTPKADNFMILPKSHIPDVDTPTSHVTSNGTVVDGGAVPILSLGPVRDSQGQSTQETRSGSGSKEGEMQTAEEATCFLHKKVTTSRDRLRGPIPDFCQRPSIESIVLS
jgi:hypothetical protein